LEHELKEIYDNKEKWVDFEGKKIRANETLLAFQGVRLKAEFVSIFF
jgi:hypothetical protein